MARVIGTIVFAVSGFLLVSFGGAIVAAPVTLPLMLVVVRRHPSRTFRTLGFLLGGLTAGEVMWAVTYVTVGERNPWIWMVPVVAGFAGGWAIARQPTAAQRTTIGTLE
jgi:hypothetical protein